MNYLGIVEADQILYFSLKNENYANYYTTILCFRKNKIRCNLLTVNLYTSRIEGYEVLSTVVE